MSVKLYPINERSDVDAERFRNELLPAYRPVVMRGLVSEWPAVAHALESAAALARYLAGFDSGRAVDAIRTPPSARGRIFYNEDMSGFNFTREKVSISAALDRMAKAARFEKAPALAVQSAPIAECLPGFVAKHPMALLAPSVAPRIWLGNAVITPAHFDESGNVACVVAGRRRFTLFPPEQVGNLYIGPIGYAPTGTPISLVEFAAPDYGRFPRFREALEAAQVAELSPGDALYIPPLWWHHVESLDSCNMLVNYWWKGDPQAPAQPGSALDVLLHGLINLRGLSPEQRGAWRAIFDHYVFSGDDATAAHIPESRRGVLGKMSPDYVKSVKDFLVSQLKK
ncbi:MAG TPA: cupin-like domain-containing protein [Usitatibacter sp.]|nr:cupin-like domain-containing protein [Usitatibacter sp.]